MMLDGLNERVRYIREHLQISRAELANYLGLSENLINKLENNSQETSLAFLEAMLHKLDVSTDWLIAGVGPMFVSFTSNLTLNEIGPVISEKYFLLKEEALEERIREMEQSITNEANIPLQHIRSLFATLLQLPVQTTPDQAVSFNKLEELSYSNKVLYYKELEKQFKSAREEFLNHFKQLYENISSGNFRHSEPNA